MAVLSLGLGSFQVGGSLAISGVTLQLVNDSVAPGNSYLYGTNASGTKGWYALSGLLGLTSLTGVNSITSAAGQNLVFAVGTGGTGLTITTSTLAATFAGNLTVSGTSGVTSPDYILGTSGPSVRSSLAARAPAQGLVFDGTAGASVTQSAFGTSDFTIGAWVRPDSLATARPLFSGASGLFYAYIGTGGTCTINKLPSGTVTATTAVVAGKSAFIAYTRSGTTGTWYVNGIAAGTGTDASDYTGAINEIAGSGYFGTYFSGAIMAFIFNRALTAADVLAVYEQGVPGVMDYASATNDAGTTVYAGGNIVNGDNSTFASDTGWWTKGVGAAISGGKLVLTTVADGIAAISRSAVLVKGVKYRFTYTISGYSAGAVRIAIGGTNGVERSANGTYIEDVVCGSANTNLYPFVTVGATTLDVDDLTVVPVGLLLVPEFNAPGNGPQLRDVSGNLAHINLPGDGVSGGVTWALPGGPASVFGEVRVASGYALGRDAVVVPEGYRIARIWVSGNGTFSIGNAASGTEVVNAFTATSTTQPATLAAYTTATRKLYVTLGTATSLTYVVHLERV